MTDSTFQCIFNELSIESSNTDKIRAFNQLNSLLVLCDNIKKEYLADKQKIKLCVKQNFINELLAHNYTIENCLKDLLPKARHLFFAMLGSPYLEEVESIISKDNESNYMECCFEYRDDLIRKKTEGLAIAHLTNNVLAVSFQSHVRWNKYEIGIIKIIDAQENSVLVKHASKIEHLKSHSVFIFKSNSFDFPSLKNILPNTGQWQKLLDKEKFNSWRDYFNSVPVEQKISEKETVLKNIAEINGYQFNNQLSTLNRKKDSDESYRKIYQANENNDRIYLSIDFEKGVFEVYNHRGEHQGEYKLDKELLSNADNKGNHDIILK